ncbi:MAG: hypothetical protein ACI360_05585 [Atopobiaceae bacterium]
MNANEELIQRLTLKRRRKLGGLSDQASKELELAVRKDPASFVDDDAERAFYIVTQALARHHASVADDDVRDDDSYAQERERRNQQLMDACNQALTLDVGCVDALLLRALLPDYSASHVFDHVNDLDKTLQDGDGPLTAGVSGDAWTNVFVRPRLRVAAALARSCIDTARFGMAERRCRTLLEISPLDQMGARYTLALTLARMEDEDGFNRLDALFSHHGNAWFHLSRVILMYKLGRMSAARRALRGFDQLCLGGTYTLLQPFYVERYLPDRPDFKPGSFDESVYAVYEADPIIADMPEFVHWAVDQPGILASAHDFADRNGFDWHDEY